MVLDSPFLGVVLMMINSTIQTIVVSRPNSMVNNNKHSLNLSLVRLNPLVLPSRYKELHRSNGIGFRKRGGKRGREIFGAELEAGYRF